MEKTQHMQIYQSQGVPQRFRTREGCLLAVVASLEISNHHTRRLSAASAQTSWTISRWISNGIEIMSHQNKMLKMTKILIWSSKRKNSKLNKNSIRKQQISDKALATSLKRYHRLHLLLSQALLQWAKDIKTANSHFHLSKFSIKKMKM